jgi:hypothetical protein
LYDDFPSAYDTNQKNPSLWWKYKFVQNWLWVTLVFEQKYIARFVSFSRLFHQGATFAELIQTLAKNTRLRCIGWLE